MSIFDKYIDKKPAKTELKIPRFGDLISEQEVKEVPLNVLILSMKNGNADASSKWTVNRIKNWCEGKNIPFYNAYVGESQIIKEDAGLRIKNQDDAGLIISPSKTIAMIRDSGNINKSYMMNDLMQQLKQNNIFCMNTPSSIAECSDSYQTYRKLIGASIPCPKTAVIKSEEMVESALKNIGDKFPVVVKSATGSMVMAESLRSLTLLLKFLWSENPNIEIIIQEYITGEREIQVHILGGNIISAIDQSGAIELNDAIKNSCIKTANILNTSWLGIKVLTNKDMENPYITNIDASPGIYDIEKITKDDIVSKIMEYASDNKNWSRERQICGFMEMVDVDAVGKLSAKFDTGNGATCQLHASDIKINENKTVNWKSNGVEFKDRPYNRIIKLMNGSEVKKVTVNLGLTFGGIRYPNVEFALDDRGKKTTPVLINRKFMQEANIIIDPTKSFLLTSNPDATSNDDTTED